MFEEHLREMLRANIAGLALSIVILTAGVAALVVWRVRSKFAERMLLWVGLFSTIYGLREAIRNPLVLIAFGISVNLQTYLVSWGDFLILIPLALVLEEVFGRGWRSSQRWSVWIFASYAAVGITAGLIAGQPYYFPEPSTTILTPVVAAVIVLNVAKRYRPPQFADLPLFLVGFAIFLIFVLANHWLPEPFHAEPLGMFALICSLGAIAARRTLRNERKLLSVEQELAAARQIQASILPDSVPQVTGLTIAARYSPMTSVAGDFYDFGVLDSDCVGVLVADVAGHGVPAALIASMVKVAFASQQDHLSNPGRVLSGLNHVFCNQIRGKYVTAAYLVINGGNGSAMYSGAGHPPLVVWRASTGSVERHENNGFFLGFRSGEDYPDVEVRLSHGDRLILYTDGLLEAMNDAGENFADRLDARIAAHCELPAPSFADALFADVKGWTARSGETSQDDDLTLLVVDFKESVLPIPPGQHR